MKDFHMLKQELYSDPGRNDLIIGTILNTLNGRKGIVFTEYIEHAKLLQTMLKEKLIKTFLIIGEVSGDDREKIRQEIIAHK